VQTSIVSEQTVRSASINGGLGNCLQILILEIIFIASFDTYFCLPSAQLLNTCHEALLDPPCCRSPGNSQSSADRDRTSGRLLHPRCLPSLTKRLDICAKTVEIPFSYSVDQFLAVLKAKDPPELEWDSSDWGCTNARTMDLKTLAFATISGSRTITNKVGSTGVHENR